MVNRLLIVVLLLLTACGRGAQIPELVREAPRYTAGGDTATDALVDGFDAVARDAIKRRGLRALGGPQIREFPAASTLRATLDTAFASTGWVPIATSDDQKLGTRLLAQSNEVLIVGIIEPPGRTAIVYLLRAQQPPAN